MPHRSARVLGSALIGPLAALLLLAAVISLTTDRLLDTRNLLNVSLQVSIIAIMAIGSTAVILTGGIDLSPGSMMALLTMVGTEIAEHYPKEPHATAQRLLEARDLRTDRGVNGVSLTLFRGEVLGLGGVVGSGRTAIARITQAGTRAAVEGSSAAEPGPGN